MDQQYWSRFGEMPERVRRGQTRQWPDRVADRYSGAKLAVRNQRL